MRLAEGCKREWHFIVRPGRWKTEGQVIRGAPWPFWVSRRGACIGLSHGPRANGLPPIPSVQARRPHACVCSTQADPGHVAEWLGHTMDVALVGRARYGGVVKDWHS